MDFGSLNMENIENILGSMSDEDMEMLKSAAQGIFAQMGQEQSHEKKENSPPPPGNNPFSSFNIDFETLSKIMSFMEKLNSQPQNPGCNLLLSLKPMLSEKRQSKVDEAIKIMSLLSFLPIINELGGNGNG